MQQALDAIYKDYPYQLKLAGECNDANGNFLGRYLFFPDSRYQEQLDEFMDCFIKTAKIHDSNDYGFNLTIDLETQGLYPHLSKIILISISWDEDSSIVFVPENFDLTKFKEVLRLVLIDNQNLKFDVKFLWHHYGVEPKPRICTQEAAKLNYCGYSDMNRFNLADLSRLIQSIPITKEIRNDFITMVPQKLENGYTAWVGKTPDFPSLNDDHIAYAARDTIVTKRLVRSVADRLVTNDLYKVWNNQERKLINILAHTELIGLRLNEKEVESAKAVAQETVATNYGKMISLYDEFGSNATKEYVIAKGTKKNPGKFNINSTQQVQRFLRDLHIMVRGTAKEEVNKALNDLEAGSSGYEFLTALKNYKKANDLITKYLDSWTIRVKEMGDNRIHPSYNLITPDAGTGRLCLDKDSLILLKDKQTKKISEALIGDEVYTHKGRFRPISRVIFKGEEEMFKVTYYEGHFISTAEHKVLTTEGWRNLSACTKGTFVIGYTINKGFYQTRINKIESVGVREVWDITVEDDHSYLASTEGGYVVHHNSAEGFNVMAVDKSLRSIVQADEGCMIASLDYSQFELRSIAANANEEGMLKLFFERAALLTDVEEVALKYGFIDPDSFAEKSETLGLSVGELELCHNFSNTDVHRSNAALIFKKPVFEVTTKERNIAKCVAGDTYIKTQKGLVQIRDLFPKKLVPDTYYKAPKGLKVMDDAGKYQDVAQLYYNGEGDAVKITFTSGRTITSSVNHRFRYSPKNLRYDWIYASDIRKGTKLFTKTTNEPIVKDRYYTLGLLSGLLDFVDTVTKYGKQTYEAEFFVTPGKQKEALKLFMEIGMKMDIEPRKLTYVGKEAAQFIDIQFETEENRRSFLAGSFEGHKYFALSSRNDFICENLRDMLLGSSFGLGIGPIKTRNNTAEFSHFYSKYLFTNEIPSDKDYWRAALNVLEDRKILKGETIDELVVSASTLLDKEQSDFFITNGLYLDTVESVEYCTVPLFDISVPVGNTYIANGLVSHNTLTYAVLYQAGVRKIQQQLFERGYSFSVAEVAGFVKTFYEVRPMLKPFMEKTIVKIKDPGYIETFLGRKKFFKLPERWRKEDYEKAVADAQREAINGEQQVPNVDAIKLSMVRLDDYIRQHYLSDWEVGRCMILIPVHDEIVSQAPKEYVREYVKGKKAIMIQAGSEAVDFRVPIEVSAKIEPYWAK